MNMSTAGTFKHSGNEDFVLLEMSVANRTNPIPLAVKTINTAPDMHEPVFSSGNRRKSRGFYQFSLVQSGGTYRAGLGRAGVTFSQGPPLTPPPKAAAGGYTKTDPYKQGIPEPEQDGSYDGKGQNLNKMFHIVNAEGSSFLQYRYILLLWQFYILSARP
jgi:hypothetical protein